MRVSAVEDHSRTRQVTPVPALIFRLRPQDNDDDVGSMRRRDVLRVLKVIGRNERLALPENRRYVKMVRELAIEASDNALGEEALRTHVRRR